MSQKTNNNNNENKVVEAITRSIARIAQEFDNLCICCNNCQASTGIVENKPSKEICPCTLPHTQRCPNLFSLQSEEVAPSESGAVDTHATTYFLDGEQGEVVLADSAVNSVATVDATEDLGLGQFLARPVTIGSYLWTTAVPIGVAASINPWKLLLETTAVKRKLENYAFMRAKLHVKVLINATPFQYGCMRVDYQPMDGILERKFRATEASNLIPHSQLPGFYLYPQLNAGGEMELPFVYHKNWLDITSVQDVTDFGTLFYNVFANLDVAVSGGPTQVLVKTLAWLTDVELMGSTGKLTLQSDEYGEGCVSAPATAIANFAGYLTKVPIIGRFARATQIGAGAVSRIASIFGFTNVPNIDSVAPFYPMSAPQLATAEISVPYQKLALDPKTELSIDPTPFGVKGEDQLALSFLKQKESYFGTCLWTTANAENTLLFSSRVTPDLKIADNILGIASANVGRRTNMTPLSHIGALFDNWRGTIKFRFKIICTKYHKGRIKIQYDPLYDISTNAVDTNITYTHIMDLGETDEVTISVPYHQALGWLRTDTDVTNNCWNAGVIAPRLSADNGSLTIRVYNELEAPVTSTVRILAYVSGGDDFEFANPSGSLTAAGGHNVASFFALQSEEVHFGSPVVPDPERYGLNFGESVHSLRKLLHRMVIMDTVPLPVGTGASYNVYQKSFQRMPYTPGYYPTNSFFTQAAGVITAGQKPYAFNSMHPMPWVASLFIGHRGSVNFCITTNSPKVVPNDIRMIRTTDQGAATATNRFVALQTSILGSASPSVKAAGLDILNFNRTGISGMAMTSAGLNPAGIFNLPDCNNYNFAINSPRSYVEGADVDGSNRQGALAVITTANTTGTDELGYTTLITATGAGPDFTCIFFCCTPTVDWLTGNPVPNPV